MQKHPTILLVDREPVLRQATALMLTHRGAKVAAAASLDDALDEASRQIFDLAVLDLEEPADLDAALALLDGMHARGCVPRKIVLCAAEPVPPEVAARVSDVLQKPFAFDLLVDAAFGPRGRRRPTRSGVFPRLVPATGGPMRRREARGSAGTRHRPETRGVIELRRVSRARR